jgi:carbon monoxide dehydrogenase subunit G
MGSRDAEVDIAAPADEVWAVIGEFGGLATWMPGVDSCLVDGDERIIGAGGRTLTERLISKDDARRELVYSLVSGVPVEHHKATITVTPSEAATHVTWAVETKPDEASEMMVPSYRAALEALKSRIEG